MCACVLVVYVCTLCYFSFSVSQEVDVNGVKFSAYNAGHVLGAAMFLIEIAGVKV